MMASVHSHSIILIFLINLLPFQFNPLLTVAVQSSSQADLNTTCLEDGGGSGGGGASLQIDLYFNSCPMAEGIIFSTVENSVGNDPRMAASLLRLHFHDCFVNGCDGSVLLDDTPAFVGEKNAPPNQNSLRGFDVIDQIKLQLEELCPGTVSCSDILATAARDSVVLLGGPSWDVEMGRLDSRTASKAAATKNIAGPNSDVPTLISKFRNVGLSSSDMVALSGAHTIGKARCSSFRSRLKTPSNPGSDMAFLNSLQQLCLGGNSTLADLDLATPATFDNQYYINLVSGQGLLNSDQALMAGNGDIVEQVKTYANDFQTFFDDFKTSMVKMGRLKPSVGTAGEVRRNCRFVN